MGIEVVSLWLCLTKKVNGTISCRFVHRQMNKNRLLIGCSLHGPGMSGLQRHAWDTASRVPRTEAVRVWGGATNLFGDIVPRCLRVLGSVVTCA